jgi:hypothetical protein
MRLLRQQGADEGFGAPSLLSLSSLPACFLAGFSLMGVVPAAQEIFFLGENMPPSPLPPPLLRSSFSLSQPFF